MRRTRDRPILLRGSSAAVATVPLGLDAPGVLGDAGRLGARGAARELRGAAEDVVLRLQRLDDSVRSGDRHPVGDFDALAGHIRELQDRIERLSREGCDAGVLADLVAARRSVSSALVLSFGLLADLR